MPYGVQLISAATGTPRELSFEVTGTTSGASVVQTPGVSEVTTIEVVDGTTSAATTGTAPEEFFIDLQGSSGIPVDFSGGRDPIRNGSSTAFAPNGRSVSYNQATSVVSISDDNWVTFTETVGAVAFQGVTPPESKDIPLIPGSSITTISSPLMFHDGSSFIIVEAADSTTSNYRIFTSTDGNLWSVMESPTQWRTAAGTGQHLNGVGFAGGYVFVSIRATTFSALFFTTDITTNTWTQFDSPDNNQLNVIRELPDGNVLLYDTTGVVRPTVDFSIFKFYTATQTFTNIVNRFPTVTGGFFEDATGWASDGTTIFIEAAYDSDTIDQTNRLCRTDDSFETITVTTFNANIGSSNTSAAARAIPLGYVNSNWIFAQATSTAGTGHTSDAISYSSDLVNFNRVAFTTSGATATGTLSATSVRHAGFTTNLGEVIYGDISIAGSRIFYPRTTARVTLNIPTASPAINEDFDLAVGLSGRDELASSLLARLQANSNLTAQFTPSAFTSNSVIGVRLIAVGFTDHTLDCTFDNRNGDLTGSSCVSLAAPVNTSISSAIRITYDSRITPSFTDIIFGAQADAGSIATVINDCVSSHSQFSSSVTGRLVTVTDNAQRADQDITVEVTTAGTTGLTNANFITTVTQQGADRVLSAGFLTLSSEGVSVIVETSNVDGDQVAGGISQGVLSNFPRFSVRSSASNNIAVIRSERNSPTPDLTVSYTPGIGSDISVTRTVVEEGAPGTSFNLGDNIQRIIATGITGTTNGTISIPAFDSDVGFFFVAPDAVNNEEVNAWADIDWNNTTKILSWSFPAVTGNSGFSSFFPTAPVNTSTRWFAVQTGGTRNPGTDYGALMFNDAGSVIVDSSFRNIAKASLSDFEYTAPASNIATTGGVQLLQRHGYRRGSADLAALATVRYDRDISIAAVELEDNQSLLTLVDFNDRTVALSPTATTTFRTAVMSVGTGIDPDDNYGITIRDDQSRTVINSNDVYPQAVFSSELDDLQNFTFGMTRDITHPAVTTGFYSLYKTIDPYWYSQFRGRGTSAEDNDILDVYGLGITRINNTTLRLQWSLQRTYTFVDPPSIRWSDALNGAYSISGSINGFLVVFELDGIDQIASGF